jgi:TRAP transporter TAXI family solute receptor
MFVVRADSSFQTIDDLKGKPVAFGTKASGLRILVNDVLEGIDLKPDQDFEQIILNKAAEGQKLVLEKNAVALWGAGIGWPGFVKVADSPAGARFIAPDAKQIEMILNRHPHLIRMTVPAGTYTGQVKAIDSVGLWSLILVRPDMDEDIVYRLARAIHLGHDKLVDRLAQGRYTNAANTVSHVPQHRLHPGAQRYYREIGLLK